MSLRFLLDTNSVSEPLRPRPDPVFMGHLEQHEASCAIAAPVWQELVHGAEILPPSKRRDGIENYLYQVVRVSFPILPYDEDAAEHHARERARLRAVGLTPPFVDGEIASVAYIRRLKLVTANTRDFERFEGLEIVDWKLASEP